MYDEIMLEASDVTALLVNLESAIFFCISAQFRQLPPRQKNSSHLRTACIICVWLRGDDVATATEVDADLVNGNLCVSVFWGNMVILYPSLSSHFSLVLLS